MNLRHFDNFMLVIIMLSSITIAIEDPVDDNSTRNKVDDKPLTNRDCFCRILLLFTNGLSQYNSEVHGFVLFVFLLTNL